MTTPSDPPAAGVDRLLLERVSRAIDPLPTADGGTTLVLATSGTPPALAVLSTGDVALVGEKLLVAVHASSAAGRRLGGHFAVLVPEREVALRVEVVEASARTISHLCVLEGRVASVRPTGEPPWHMRMEFFADPDATTGGFLTFWAGVRRWLQDGAAGEPPRFPAPLPIDEQSSEP